MLTSAISYAVAAVTLLSNGACSEYFAHHSGNEGAEGFSNEWIVRVEGGDQVAQLLALEAGCIYGGKISDFPNTYIFIKDDHSIERRDHPSVTRTLFDNPKVQWAEQLFAKKRQKRDYLHSDSSSSLPKKHGNLKFKSLVYGKFKRNNNTDNEITNLTNILEELKQIVRVKRDDMKVPRQEEMMFNDELWSQEWYLHDTRTRDDLPKLDLNVIPVYRMGITGKGVKVSILDDGIEYLHDDLKDNYDPSISWDCNEKDADPAPKYDSTHRNAHGTRCAGEVAMTANNGKCGVGIAYGASIGGIKLLDGLINDRVEGAALGFGFDKIDIYSASWGPNDDGRTVEGPGRLAQEALERGVTKVRHKYSEFGKRFGVPQGNTFGSIYCFRGQLNTCSEPGRPVAPVEEEIQIHKVATQGRNGKGTIFVFASGNGGSHDDNCNCDGYIGSIYTVAIGSASQRGAFPWYGEPCAATMAVTYSSGAYQDQMITTTDLNNGCTIKHTGTSASAPLAAGIIALALEANKNMTWRDVQHLIVWTSEYMPLADNLGWQMNGAGFRFDVRFGFGLMNAHALVTAASQWTNVPEKSICEVKAAENINISISYNSLYTTNFESTGCSGRGNEVNFLEHLELKVNIMYSVRGVLEVYLTSPRGTRLPVLSHRRLDRSPKGFTNWKFMSVGTWGEDPRGTWSLEIFDGIGPPENNGKVGPLTLILHGTKDQPDYIKKAPRIYNTDYQSFDDFIKDDIETSLPPNEIKIDVSENTNNLSDILNEIENNPKFYEQNANSKVDDLESVYGIFSPLNSNDDNVNKQDYYDDVTGEMFDEDRVLNRVHHQNSKIYDDIKYRYQEDIIT